jgi:hypothetical protein
MLVWDGVRWVKRIRVFAGLLQNGTNIIEESVGSQVGLTGQREVGHILVDQNNIGIKHGNKFLTTETLVNASASPLNYYKLESEQLRAEAVDTIPKFHVVYWQGKEKLGVAGQSTPGKGAGIGIALEDMVSGEVKHYVTEGFVTNEDWNFSEVGGTLLFVGKNGEVTTTVPTRYSLQRVGQVINPTTIYLNIGEFFIIETGQF